MSIEIVQVFEGEPRVSSEVIAQHTDNQHKNVLGLIQTYQADLGAFGQVAFETRAGYNNSKVTVAHLNEPQSTLLMTKRSTCDPTTAKKISKALSVPADRIFLYKLFTVPQTANKKNLDIR